MSGEEETEYTHYKQMTSTVFYEMKNIEQKMVDGFTF